MVTIGERREELTSFPFKKLRKIFNRAKREHPMNTDWVDKRKRKDLVQSLLNLEIGLGGRYE